MNKLRVGIAQLNFTIGDFDGNYSKIEAAVSRLAPVSDIIAFTELCLSGYYPMDLLDNKDFIAKEQAALTKVAGISAKYDATLLIGCTSPNLGTGKPKHNSVLAIRRGEIVAIYHKKLLPTYDIFDERRHFEPGSTAPMVLDVGNYRVGVIICEDGWNDAADAYAENPVKSTVAAGANVLLSINASPSNLNKQNIRHSIFCNLAKKYDIPIVYANQVGGNDQIVFDGASFIATPNSFFNLAPFEESLGLAELDGKFATLSDIQSSTHGSTSLAITANASEFFYKQICLGLQDYMRKCGFAKVIIGSSGGIDSALTMALAADALGPENVTALTMPSKYSSVGSVTDSITLAHNLGISLLSQPINTEYDAFIDGFMKNISLSRAHGATLENLQARIRGTVLMAYSNEFGALLLSTGNKSEMSVGYATLYGDMNGGLNLIGDLYKTEVFALAQWYNQYHGLEIIPAAIINKAPSAELSEGQVDSDSLPPYPILDAILKNYIEGDPLDCSIPSPLIAKVHAMVKTSEFKRRQAPPIIRLRPRAFGNGRQIPIAANY